MSGRATSSIWAGVRDGVRSRLWPLPVAGVLVAAAVGIWLPRLDAAVDDQLSGGMRSYLFFGGADAARALLETVAGSLITVTSLTFSLTVVTLQLASSQFSPRLLRLFTSDLVVQGTLTLFLGTFTCAVTVLRTVRSSSDSDPDFVPALSVTVCFVLALASVIALVLFLAHLTRIIRVESMLRSVHQGATATFAQELDEAQEETPSWQSLVPGRPSTPVLAGSSGFLVRIDEGALLEAAVDADALVLVDALPGSSIVAGTPIGAVWTSCAPHEGSTPDLTETVREAVSTGFERISLQDISYGLRQLTDVATKALSPGINDPTTAVHALSHSSALLCELAGRDLGPRVLRDGRGTVRVVLARPNLADLLRMAVDQPSRYGATEPAILGRLLMLLREVAWSRRPEQSAAVSQQLERLRRLMQASELSPDDRAELAAAAMLVEQALAGRWDAGSRTH